MLARLLLKFLLLRRCRQNIAAKRPQLACYAFDLITAKIHIDGRYESNELYALETLLFPMLKSDGFCLDIGANIGNHSVAFADYFATVHAFEPNPNVFRRLQINSDLRPNIEVHMIGCSDTETEIETFEQRGNLGSTGVSSQGGATAGKCVTFKVAPLDTMSFLKKADEVTFVKLDVEGHEAEALRGAAATLQKHQPVIAMEVGRESVSNGSNAALEVLKEFGYAFFYEIPRKHSIRRLLDGDKSRIIPVEQLQQRNYPLFLAATTALPVHR